MIHNIKKHLSNVFGWSSNRKIVVLESDDWGSIRMPSTQAFESLRQLQLPISIGSSERYNKFDTLESPADLECLFDVLTSVRDKNNRPAVLTPLCVVANPDFSKIEQTQFHEYFFEPITDTFEKIYGNHDSFNLWREGIEKRLFVPQFHGREHLNVPFWMRALASGDKDALTAFKFGFWGFQNIHPLGVTFQAAFFQEKQTDLDVYKQIIASGLDLFESLMGYRASYFVPPNGQIDRLLYSTAYQSGIEFIYEDKLKSVVTNNRSKRVFHRMGELNSQRQIVLTRNSIFEPSMSTTDSVGLCLSDIETSFLWNKPAVISSHRVNYIGQLHNSNRDNGLKQLKQLLQGIVKRWPDVEFMTSAELGQLIKKEKC